MFALSQDLSEIRQKRQNFRGKIIEPDLYTIKKQVSRKEFRFKTAKENTRIEFLGQELSVKKKNKAQISAKIIDAEYELKIEIFRQKSAFNETFLQELINKYIMKKKSDNQNFREKTA